MRKVPKSFSSLKIATILAIFIFLSDQVSKYIIVNTFQIGDVFDVLPFFNIVHVRNFGVTFGMMKNAFHPCVFAVISLIVVIGLILWSMRRKTMLLPVAMIISGAIGNAVDRLVYGSVVDFLDFYVFNHHWPAFNIADSAIVIAVSILCFYNEELS